MPRPVSQGSLKLWDRRRIWWPTIGFVGICLTLLLFDYANLVKVEAGAWILLMAVALVCQSVLLVVDYRAQSRSAVELVPVGIFRTSVDGRCLYVNKQWQELAGISLEEALGDGWVRGLHPDDRERTFKLWNEAVAKADIFQAEYRFKRPDGRVAWLLGRAVPLFDRKGNISEFLGTITEITDRVQAERQAEEAIRIKTEFLTNMSHEIRTPISGIVGATELLSKQSLQPSAETYVDVISTSADSLLMLIDSLLDFSKIEAGKLGLDEIDFAVRDTVQAVVQILKAKALAKGITLTSQIADDVPERVHGDSVRLHQILVNLVSNAVKFTSEGGVEMRVSSAAKDSDDQNPDDSDGKCRIVFEVADTGIGIDPSMKERLFDPFTQADSSTSRSYGGSGLGLSICKRIVEMMDGDIRLESRLGEGSTFIVALPFAGACRSDPEPGRVPATREPQLHNQKDFRVLVVDDNHINRMIAGTLLNDLGYQTFEASNGLEALKMLQDDNFDLILLDCQMPELDGYETARRIRSNEPEGRRVPIIAATAHAVSGDRERCLEAGMDDYISKPYASDLLDRTLRRWLWKEDGSTD